MRKNNIVDQDEEYSINDVQDQHQTWHSILQLLKKANKTVIDIQKYIDQNDCEQLGDLADIKSTTNGTIGKYNHMDDYYNLYFQTFKGNQSAMTSLENLANKLEKLRQYLTKIEKQQKSYDKLPSVSKKVRNRRISADIVKQFECPYQNCYKEYGSDVSLNLHIKIKHKGGNKSDRDKLAVDVQLFKHNGAQIPEIKFNLPPGFLEDYKRKFLQSIKNTSS